MAVVHIFLSPALPHHVPGVTASFSITETCPSARATLRPLDGYQRWTCKNVPSPVLQICFTLPTKARRPPVSLKHTVTGTHLPSGAAGVRCHTLAPANVLTPWLRCATPRCPPIFLLARLLCGQSRERGSLTGNATDTPAPPHPGPPEAQAREKATNTGDKRPHQAASHRGLCRRPVSQAAGH